jgi:uncharacterized circularly permuted ATP-grasp superfamily protein
LNTSAAPPHSPPARGFYEAALATGDVHPDWGAMLAQLESLGRLELRKRWARAQQLLEENGVTYDVYGDPRGIDRPWQLSAVPFLVSSDEWRDIERSVMQRARLLSEILDDLYGPQRVVERGWLPPELVHAHPGFLRACHGAVPRARGLVIYGADLARSPDGRWCVIADRTQAPSGSGAHRCRSPAPLLWWATSSKGATSTFGRSSSTAGTTSTCCRGDSRASRSGRDLWS